MRVKKEFRLDKLACFITQIEMVSKFLAEVGLMKLIICYPLNSQTGRLSTIK